MKEKSLIDKIVDSFFDRTKLLVLALTIGGFILRLIAAKNLGISADDANHAVFSIGIFNSDKLVFWGGSTNLWYYIQGVFYYIFGISQVSSRLAASIFGSLTILLMFLFVKKVFKSEKAAIISSFLVATSPVLIKSTLPEMDIAVSFFLLLASYFLFSYFESKSKKDLIFSAVIIGLGTMIKLYFAFFALSFFIFLILKERKNVSQNKLAKDLLLFGAIIFVLITPTLAHNYLLYKDKGFMDLIFTNTFKLGVDKASEFYSWGAGWMAKSDYGGFFFGNQANFDPTPIPGLFIVLGFLLKGDPLLFILGLLGLILGFKHYKRYFWFFLILFVPAFVYLGAQIPMSKHFVWIMVILAPFAGHVGELIQSKFKIRLRYLLLLFLIINLLYLGMPRGSWTAHFYGESSIGQVIDYKNEFIKGDSLVVADSRIYRGNIHWALAGTNYIEASQFFNVAQQLNTQSATLRNIDVYYIECVSDDCGWGTISSQPDFNESMEKVTEWFANLSSESKSISAPDFNRYYLPFMDNRKVEYTIYKTVLSLNPVILNAVKQTHVWFLYPIGYDRTISPIFDDYKPSGFIDKLINKFAWLALYLELLAAFLAIFYTLYLFLQENEMIK